MSLFSSYGFLNNLRLEPITGRVRVVATDFDECNGIVY